MVYRFVICRADALFVVDRENRGDDNRTHTAVADAHRRKKKETENDMIEKNNV